MSVYSQPELLRRSDIFTTNGLKSEAQAILAGVGFPPEEIACGAAKLSAVKTADAHKTALDAQKRKATQTEKIAREAAQKEITSLSDTVRVLFAGDPAILVLMDLQTHYETITNAETGETKRVAVQGSKATAELIAHWRVILAGATRLAPAEQAQLALAGWPQARVTATIALIEGYAKADIDQQVAISAAQSASIMYKVAVKDLETWYLKARRLSRIAIKDTDPKNLQNLNELLALD